MIPMRSLALILLTLLPFPLVAATPPGKWQFSEELTKACEVSQELQEICARIDALSREVRAEKGTFRALLLPGTPSAYADLSPRQLDAFLEASRKLDNQLSKLESLHTRQGTHRAYLKEFLEIVDKRDHELTPRQIAGGLLALPLLYLPAFGLDLAGLRLHPPYLRGLQSDSQSGELSRLASIRKNLPANLVICFPVSHLAHRFVDARNHHERYAVKELRLDSMPPPPTPFPPFASDPGHAWPLTPADKVSAERLHAVKYRIRQLTKEEAACQACLAATDACQDSPPTQASEQLVCWPENTRQAFCHYIEGKLAACRKVRRTLETEAELLSSLTLPTFQTPVRHKTEKAHPDWQTLVQSYQEQEQQRHSLLNQADTYRDMAGSCKALLEKEEYSQPILAELLASRQARLETLQARCEIDAAQCQLIQSYLADIAYRRQQASHVGGVGLSLTVHFLFPTSTLAALSVQEAGISLLALGSRHILLNGGNLSAARDSLSWKESLQEALYGCLRAPAMTGLSRVPGTWAASIAQDPDAAQWAKELAGFYHALSYDPCQLSLTKRLLGKTGQHMAWEVLEKTMDRSGLRRWWQARKHPPAYAPPEGSSSLLLPGLYTLLRSTAAAATNELGLAWSGRQHHGIPGPWDQLSHKLGHGAIAFSESFSRNYLEGLREETPSAHGWQGAGEAALHAAGGAMLAEVVAEHHLHSPLLPQEEAAWLLRKARSAYLGKMAALVMGWCADRPEESFQAATRAIDCNFLTTRRADVVYIPELEEELWRYLAGKSGEEKEHALGQFLLDKGFAGEEEVEGRWGRSSKGYRCYRTATVYPTLAAMGKEVMRKDRPLGYFVNHILPAVEKPCLAAARGETADMAAQASLTEEAPQASHNAWRDMPEYVQLLDYACGLEVDSLCARYPEQMGKVLPGHPLFASNGKPDKEVAKWYNEWQPSGFMTAGESVCRKALEYALVKRECSAYESSCMCGGSRPRDNYNVHTKSTETLWKEAQEAYRLFASHPCFQPSVYQLGALSTEREGLRKSQPLSVRWTPSIFRSAPDPASRLAVLDRSISFLHRRLLGTFSSFESVVGGFSCGAAWAGAELTFSSTFLGWQGIKATWYVCTDPSGSWQRVKSIPSGVYQYFTEKPSPEEKNYRKGYELLYGYHTSWEKCKTRGHLSVLGVYAVKSGYKLFTQPKVVAQEAEVMTELAEEGAEAVSGLEEGIEVASRQGNSASGLSVRKSSGGSTCSVPERPVFAPSRIKQLNHSSQTLGKGAGKRSCPPPDWFGSQVPPGSYYNRLASGRGLVPGLSGGTASRGSQISPFSNTKWYEWPFLPVAESPWYAGKKMSSMPFRVTRGGLEALEGATPLANARNPIFYVLPGGKPAGAAGRALLKGGDGIARQGFRWLPALEAEAEHLGERLLRGMTLEEKVRHRFEELVKKAQALYPKLAGKIERHHIEPIYIGGAKKGRLAPLDAAYHQLITNEFRRLRSYGKSDLLNAVERRRLMDQVYAEYPLPPGYHH